eukprot:scaffold1640_cov161-Amphora_coffeaeformis.AAC.7
MCGIYLYVTHGDPVIDETPPSWLTRRGPDHHGKVQWTVAIGAIGKTTMTTCCVTLQASVLSMRGKLSPQPVALLPCEDDYCQVYLCWNGEVYQAALESDDDNNSPPSAAVGEPSVSDTEFVADLLRATAIAGAENHHPDMLLPRLAAALRQLVNAEFAICVATSEWIYYAKDAWGRRSLLVGSTCNDDDDGSDNKNYKHWILSSVATNAATDTQWLEVEPGIVFAHHVATGSTQRLAYYHPNTTAPRIHPVDMTTDPVDTLYQLLRTAVRQRIAGTHHVAVLFSGGLDSVILAALVLQECHRVTLTNVSFISDAMATTNESSTAADTRAAVASYAELKQLFPDCDISFFQRQVPWNEVQQQQVRLKHLIYPKSTVMDLNIATAFWFAAETATSCRILLTGLGADEQLGGYGRHRKAWERHAGNGRKQKAALVHELHMDQQRLWERNLGRDDRVLSDTSKETRYPFLDSAVMRYLAELDVDQICNFNLPPGQGDKYILRQLAVRLGLASASVAVKRASNRSRKRQKALWITSKGHWRSPLWGFFCIRDGWVAKTIHESQSKRCFAFVRLRRNEKKTVQPMIDSIAHESWGDVLFLTERIQLAGFPFPLIFHQQPFSSCILSNGRVRLLLSG